MRKQWVMAVAVLACTAFATWVAVAAAAPEKKAATKVTLQLKWVTQAQFAGYYAALEKGFYDKAGLDVSIKVGGPSITPETVVAGNRAEFGLDWLPNLFATREKGSKLVSVAPGVRAVGDDRADLEVERDQHDLEDARQEGRGLVLRQRARALRGAPEERHRPHELE